ncbi:hypothetical protein PtB15_16B345 [Puccinia triticina]|nr:hypothetical protein PtB15_16B345 [Puccinia triticina]
MPPQHRPRPPKNNFSSPASAFNTLATGLGRITQGKIGINPDRSFDYAPPPEFFTLIPCRPSLTTQNSGDGSSAASHYGGASSTSISYDLPGWCAAVLSVLCLPKPAGNNSTTKTNGFWVYLLHIHQLALLKPWLKLTTSCVAARPEACPSSLRHSRFGPRQQLLATWSMMVVDCTMSPTPFGFDAAKDHQKTTPAPSQFHSPEHGPPFLQRR